jgi:DNA replication protein DnaC
MIINTATQAACAWHLIITYVKHQNEKHMNNEIQEQLQKIGAKQPPLSELYKEIELTEEEKNEAIEKALFDLRYSKYAEQKSREYYKQVTAPQEVKRYTAQQLFVFLEQDMNFTIDADNRKIVELICLYFTNDPEFEKLGFSLEKGIMLYGGVGVGKTHLLNLFRNNQKYSYQVVSCQDVEGIYAKNGPDANQQTGEQGLRRYFGLVSLQATNQYGQNTLGFMFDDLGQEIQNTKYYGTERNVMQEVLSQRYKNKLFTSTHVTTNLTAEEIKTAYGARVSDRMREMFNIIEFPTNAKSRRK